MARLIDANAFLKDILTAGIGKTIIEYSESDIGYMIRRRPTVDAVKVVRCRDCKYYYDYGVNRDYCCHRSEYGKQVFDVKFKADDFCSYGERKDGDGNG